ncbi:hypothetical protein [Pseudomarimonas salicorniae]|uniref:Extracellular repeat, HAF family n=1 Tax=Pseudomarimonas salicorniae TaxID=2933270 RepID=A0ABT0GL83_9GAMM|nr:hypothetical protein [Lysobacter sp. CAU 1642]MCK7595310.1 hypothetical protein [Lysobacter sp. CAU 1642]
MWLSWLVLLLSAEFVLAEQFDLAGPPGSVGFGAQIAVLPNGNLVVTDPRRPPDGAAYLYSRDLQLLSTVTNVSPFAAPGTSLDTVRIVVLRNGNYLLVNETWSNGGLFRLGMVAWANGETGISGSISSSNALIGARADDSVGFPAVHPLANGNYVVESFRWSNGASRVGAITWGSGTSGVSGPVSAENSVIGSSIGDSPSFGTALSNGNYVLLNTGWGTPERPYLGAAMWVDGTVGATGFMTAENSLVGSAAEDFILRRVYPLVNGNFVLALPYWDNGDQVNAGAAVWGDGTRPMVGTVSAANALVGTRTGSYVSYDEVQALSNGHYVVASSDWDSPTGTNNGAVTWGNGAVGTTGEVSAANSLVGGADFQFVGGDPEYLVDSVIPLANGHYVTASPYWGGQKGAVTWGDGTKATVGVVSPRNSIVGNSVGDRVGSSGVTALTNGHYVIASAGWKGVGGVPVGAATWVNGTGPRTGSVGMGNSLVGNTPMSAGMAVTALANGHYVVAFPGWDRGSVSQAGAVVWGNGELGSKGSPSPQSALVGSRERDFVGWPIALSDGNYVVCSGNYSSDSATRVGAVTWASGWGGRVGEINASNSLIGSSRDDQVCSGHLDSRTRPLPDGQYLVASPFFDDGEVFDAGAFTLAETAVTGHLNYQNSVIGSVSEGGETGGRPGVFAAYDEVHRRLFVGRGASNLVTVVTGARVFRSSFE